MGGVVILIVMAWMGRLDTRIKSRSSIMELYMEFSGKKPFSNFIEFAKENQFEIREMEISKSKMAKDVDLCAVITISSQIRRNHETMIEMLSGFPGVNYIEEL
jgi:putative Mg2+ transporter-C (MgtC) family protein